jgi:hypothetical protein
LIGQRCPSRNSACYTWGKYYRNDFLGIIGVIADSLNHLVFTMPFLPSEAEETKLLINQRNERCLSFHYYQ